MKNKIIQLFTSVGLISTIIWLLIPTSVGTFTFIYAKGFSYFEDDSRPVSIAMS